MKRKANLTQDEKKADSFAQFVMENSQDEQHTELTDTPGVSDFKERQFKLYVSGSTLRLYTRYEDALYYINFTAA